MGALSARALALWCALLLTCARASAYTVDCNHEYTDCDTELSKLTSEDEEVVKPVERFESVPLAPEPQTPPTSTAKKETTPVINETLEIDTVTKPYTDIPEEITVKPKPRLLNLNVDELQNFANALHNDTNAKGQKKILPDLSDVTLDDDDDESKQSPVEPKVKDIPDKFYTNLQAPFHALMGTDRDRASEEIDTCKENEVTYKVGDHMDRGCEEICECAPGGVFECSPRCKHPYIRRGRRLNDPLCFESPVDECCSIIACATGDKKTMGHLDICTYGNETHTIGSKWNIGCQQTCTCERNSVVTCKPRCGPLPVSDKCINVQDPNDPCCEVQVCDVSHDAHEEPENVTTSTTTIKPRSTTEVLKGFQDYDEREHLPLNMPASIGSVTVLQNNSVQVNLMHMNNSESPIHLQLSSNGGQTFTDVELTHTNMILNLEGGRDYILKSKETGAKFNFTITASDSGTNEVPYDAFRNESMVGCYQDGQFYAVGDEFHIGCEQLCECTGMDTRECAALVCPSHVGLELVSKGCVRWAPNPPATPPNCCPRTARCLSDGTCHYKGVAVPNWSEVPITLTGCEQRCFCENGELDCQDVCSPLPPVPPQNFRCPPNHRPAAVNISDEDCCKQWGCVPNSQPASEAPPFLPTVPPEIHFPQDDIDYDQNNIHRPTNPVEPALAGLPPGLTIPPSFGDNNRKLSVLSLQADSPTSVKMLFGLPPVLVGLRGSVDLRYTDKSDQDISHWYSQVFAPADEILTTPRLEFRLTGLKPSTSYKIRGKLYLHNLPVEPESEIYNVRTQDLPTAPVEEKRREIDCHLTVIDVNDTTAHVTWRHFDEQELIYIDGIQVRYRPVGTPIYSMTELLHHSRSAAELHDLRPDTKYETSLVLVPPPRSTTELIDPAKVEFKTLPHVDPYNWTVNIEVRTVGAGAAEVWWSGIPAPAERWVRVFRAAHACKRPGGTEKHDLHDIHSHHGHEIDKQGHDHDRYERDAFRLAARDLPPAITISGLLPDTKCRVWLELFLTNGKVKTSNVLEINTKSLDNPEPIDNEIASSSVSGRRGDYYGALVGVGAVAALGALTSLLLLLVVLRRHRPRSVPITSVPSAPRESSLPPYDNPAYKLELQQETMDL